MIATIWESPLWQGIENAAGGALGSGLMGAAWKGSLMLLGAWFVTLAMKRRAASARHLVWTAGMGALLLLPLLSLVLPTQELAVLPASPAAQTESTLALEPAALPSSADGAETRVQESLVRTDPVGDAFGYEAIGTVDLSDPESEGPVTASTASQLASALAKPGPWLALWALIALLIAMPALVGIIGYHQLLRVAKREAHDTGGLPIEEVCEALGMHEPVRVLVTEATAMPMACGLLRPTVFVPPSTLEWPADKQRSVLLHELAHVKRRDCATQLFATLARALHWFNPLAWYATRRMVVERERACDDFVLRAGTEAEDYADCLIDVAKSQRAPALSAAFALTMAQPSQLEGRLLAILDHRKRRQPLSKRGISLATAVFGMVVVPLATLQLTTREALGLEFIAGHRTVIDNEENGSVESLAAALRKEVQDSQRRVIGEELKVAPDGSAPHRSIQGAIDAATDGATIRIAAGVYEESLAISKSLTLIGSGSDNTRVRPKDSPSALTLTGGAKIELRNLRFSTPAKAKEGKLGSNAILDLQDGRAAIEHCVIIDGPANGILVGKGGDLDLRNSFVAAVWAEGVYVSEGARATIANCDVRNVYHYGIKIRGEGVVVENCRVSGTGWHGVRYDHVSPKIHHNLLFNNERSGIYYNGATEAQITQNHFYGNGYVGIMAWGKGRDLIENNTFNQNGRSGLEILENSNPKVRRNLFVGSGTGVANSNVEDSSPYLNHPEQVVFDNNGFWKNKVDTRWVVGRQLMDPEKTQAFFDARENAQADPAFVDPEAKDYSLMARSWARMMNVGAQDPLPFESPWPMQEEEKRFLEAKAPKESPKLRAAGASAYEMAKPWIEGVLQIDDAQLRAASIDAIRAALLAGDEATRHAGLTAFLGTLDAIEDKAAFRELILPSVNSSNGEIRRSAYYALYNSGVQEGDLDMILEAAKQKMPGLHRSISHLLFLYSDGELKGKASHVLEDLFKTDNHGELKSLLGGIWGARLSPELEARVIELAQSDDRDLRHNAIYFGLSTLYDKSLPVIQVLIKAAEGSDSNDSGRALWGLSYGVPAEHAPTVAEFGLKLFQARSSVRTRDKALDLIEAYAGPDQLAGVEILAANELVSEAFRERLNKVAERIRNS